jgi:hypothetical protein
MNLRYFRKASEYKEKTILYSAGKRKFAENQAIGLYDWNVSIPACYAAASAV